MTESLTDDIVLSFLLCCGEDDSRTSLSSQISLALLALSLVRTLSSALALLSRRMAAASRSRSGQSERLTNSNSAWPTCSGA